MKDWLLQSYYQAPYALKVLAASARGCYLRWWRYGPETERLVEEALERETWSASQWRVWQENRLASVLHRAVHQVPYYREEWARRRRQGDRASWEYLENWPILEKELLRSTPTLFVAEDCNIKSMFHEHTSGTSGKPLDLYWSRDTARAWYALFEARWRRWYGVSRHDRWAILGGQLVSPVQQRQPPFWVWNASFKQLYLSSYHLSPALIPHYLEALRRYRVTYLFGYTSSLFALGQEVLNRGIRDLVMKVAITNAEPVYDHQRQVISEAFQCPVRETYGMSEIVAAAGECEAGNLHLWPEAGIIEVLSGESLKNQGSGEMVGTGLFNTDMPLIRYRVGDRGTLPTEDEACPCGRTLPRIASIDGRVDDVLYTKDGRSIGRLDPVFKAQLPIREAQIIQETLDRIRVRFVPAPGFTPAAARAISERLQERMGSIEVIFEQVSAIPRGPSGKFRGVICQLPLHEKELWRETEKQHPANNNRQP